MKEEIHRLITKQFSVFEQVSKKNLIKTTRKRHQFGFTIACTHEFFIERNGSEVEEQLSNRLASAIINYLSELKCKFIIGNTLLKCGMDVLTNTQNIMIIVELYKYKGRPPKTTG